jgi:poly-beta-1,6-N-acetyl-D-glucosamine synthase
MNDSWFEAMESRRGVTVLVPAYNEAASVADTVGSLLAQTRPPAAVIVIDDCSTDGTAKTARAAGARVMRPARNTGSKAGALNFALPLVHTELVLAVDADTILARDAIEKLLPSFELPQVAAACGFLLPRHVDGAWERGAHIERLFAARDEHVQEYDRPMVAAGGFSMYRTSAVKAQGGWPAPTSAEDTDLTWQLYQSGQAVRFVLEAVSYPIELADPLGELRSWSPETARNVRGQTANTVAVPVTRSKWYGRFDFGV